MTNEHNTIRVAGTVPHSFVDGPGIRFTVFFQGCPNDCPGCQNPEAHDMNGGTIVPIDSIIDQIKSTRFLDGITLSGGEPLVQPKAAMQIADAAHEMGLNVWCYTGFVIEALPKRAEELLNHIDVLVDGRYVQELRPAKYRGSSSQRIINMRKRAMLKEIDIKDAPKRKWNNSKIVLEIEQFLSSGEPAREIVIENNDVSSKQATYCNAIKRHNFPAFVTRKHGRLFLVRKKVDTHEPV